MKYLKDYVGRKILVRVRFLSGAYIEEHGVLKAVNANARSRYAEEVQWLQLGTSRFPVDVNVQEDKGRNRLRVSARDLM